VVRDGGEGVFRAERVDAREGDGFEEVMFYRALVFSREIGSPVDLTEVFDGSSEGPHHFPVVDVWHRYGGF